MTLIDLLRWLSDTSVAVSILIIVILIIRKPFAKQFGARAAYALWLAPLLRIFMPELLVLPAPILPAESAWALVAMPVDIATPVAETNYDAKTLAAAIALFLWITVAIAFFSMKIEAQSRFMRAMMASSKKAPNEILMVADAIRRALGVKRMLRIRLCDERYGPSVIGLFRPVIFLPSNFIQDYSAEERRLALAHEMAHVARGDMTATLAALLFQAAQWPNPLAHFAFRLFRTDQEAACDAYVLSNFNPDKHTAGDYASAILKSAASAKASPAFGLSLGHPLKERLMLLRNPKQSPARKIVGGITALTLVLAGLAATASYGYAAHDADAGEKVRKEQRVMILGSDDDEALVLPSIDGEYEMRVVRPTLDGEDGMRFVMPMVKAGDGETHVFNYAFRDGEHDHHFAMEGMENCTDENGESVSAKLEWSDDADQNGDSKAHSIICVSGEDDPEKRAEALRKIIDQMEEQSRKAEQRRKKMIAGLRKQLRELEKK